MSFPVLKYLSVGYTEIWVPNALVPLVRFADCVRSISSTGLDLLGLPDLEPPRRLLQDLKSFDLVVSWYGANRSEFREACLAISPKFEFHRALPPSDWPGHATDFFALQVGAPSGLTPAIAIEPGQVHHRIVIHPFSGSSQKNWPLAQFEEAAASLSLPVVWIAGPQETLRSAVHLPDLGELARFLAESRLYLGNDSGVSHLAAAVGVPSVVIFRSTSPQLWAPRGSCVSILERPSTADVQGAVARQLSRLRDD